MNNNPFPNNPLFKSACEICEAYTGEEHFYGDCTKCPVYKMADRMEVQRKELRELRLWKSYDEHPEDMGR